MYYRSSGQLRNFSTAEITITVKGILYLHVLMNVPSPLDQLTGIEVSCSPPVCVLEVPHIAVSVVVNAGGETSREMGVELAAVPHPRLYVSQPSPPSECVVAVFISDRSPSLSNAPFLLLSGDRG